MYRNKGFAPLLLIMIVVAIGLFSYFAIKQKLLLPKSTPTPTAINNIEEFKPENGVSDFKNFFKIDFNKISLDTLLPMECVNSPREFSSLNDSNLENNINNISNHQFPEEQKVTYPDGHIEILNPGVKSKRDITFTKICKSGKNYIFLFESENNFTRSSGGGGGRGVPTGLAYIDSSGKLIIEERPWDSANKIKINDHFVTEIAYFGCNTIYGMSNTSYYFGCSGGDGPAGASAVYRLDVNSKDITELAFCESGPSMKGNYIEDVCANSKNTTYFSQKTSY